MKKLLCVRQGPLLDDPFLLVLARWRIPCSTAFLRAGLKILFLVAISAEPGGRVLAQRGLCGTQPQGPNAGVTFYLAEAGATGTTALPGQFAVLACIGVELSINSETDARQ